MSDSSDVIYFYFFINKRFARTPNPLGNTFRPVAKVSNLSGNDFRQARKCQTIREMTFAMRGNAKPLGKRLLTELFERYCHITIYAAIIVCFLYLILIKLYTMSKAWIWPKH